ncbi:hypothetical protein KA068_02640 [Candidatus Saccharibacteria bacterium]|jgi:guanylate kinase|nr:hypothetical protein [Candidatus Saccharibacteria bacterium]
MGSNLKNMEKIKKILANYSLSEEIVQLLSGIDLVLFVGITSSGKNTVMNELLGDRNYKRVVSDTTRDPRPGEVNGVDYWFKSEQEFLEGLESGSYIEAAVVHNRQLSGLHSSEFKNNMDGYGKFINEVDVRGVDTFKQVKPDTTTIFVIPPSFEVWKQRLLDRGQMDDTELRSRLISAHNELLTAVKTTYYHFLVNDNLEKAVSGAQKIINGEIDTRHEEYGRRLALELLEQIDKFSTLA